VQKKLQLTLFDAERDPVLDEIEQLDISTLTPIEALTILYDLQKKVKQS
jgi:DNA mismatch repair protein MutS